MTQPLALLLYENLLPGTQLANRLQDAGWRVQTLHDAAALARTAEELKPVLVVADLASSSGSVCHGIANLRRNVSTAHIPVIAFSADEAQHKSAADAGATLAVGDAAILQHLNQLIDQAMSDL